MLQRVLPRAVVQLARLASPNAGAIRSQWVPRGLPLNTTAAQTQLSCPSLLAYRRGWSHTSYFCTNSSSNKTTAAASAEASKAAEAPKRRMADDIKEYRTLAATGSTAVFDEAVIAPQDANSFPRIKTTSLSTKRIVIADKARKKAATLVMVAFRSFADDQLQSWKNAFVSEFPAESVQYYDVTINESFASQALSGFIQRLQRSRTDPALHDYHVAFNSKAREPLEALLPSRNRMFGYVLLLDSDARVRFRASGMASSDGLNILASAVRQLIGEDSPKTVIPKA